MNVINWTIDIIEDHINAMQSFVVGRVMADELRRCDIEERGENCWESADADSMSLEGAYAALTKNGEFNEELFEAGGDPFVFLYDFTLHPDYDEWTRSIIDAVCRQFTDSAAIISYKEVIGDKALSLGFIPLMNRTQSTEYIVRDNALKHPFGINNYQTKEISAERHHEAWLYAQLDP